MKRYFDCDGVILDTEEGLRRAYLALKSVNPNVTADWFYANVDWDHWLKTHTDINNAIEILKSNDPDENIILTSINSLDELKYKVLFFRSVGLKNPIIGVPPGVQKYEMVDPVGNILVEDKQKNIDGWNDHGGYAIHIDEVKDLNDVMAMDEDYVKRQIAKRQKRIKRD